MSLPTEKPGDTPAKLLWLHPINISDYDTAFAEMLARVKRPNVEIHVMSLKIPNVTLDNLEFRTSEAKIWWPVVHIAHYASQNGFDGMAIGCFYDTALDEAREACGDAVVVGPCEASLKAISTLCNRFSVIIGVDKWKVQMENRIRHYGYGDKLVSFRSIGMHVTDFQKDHAKTADAIRQAVKLALEDGAEGIILGCTLEFGFYATLQEEFDVPVIDCTFACYKELEHAAMNKIQFGWKTSRLRSMAAMDPKIIAHSGIFDEEPPIGNCVVVPRTDV